MILPGVSGGYLLLVLGVYVPILTGVDSFKEALSVRDMQTLFSVGLAVVLPVGLGVVTGVVGVSNLLRWLLKRFEKATLGVLLGLLVGAVVGLWPFQASVEPHAGMMVKGQTLHETTDIDGAILWLVGEGGEPLEPEDLPTATFTPAVGQIAGAVGLILLGFALTMGIDRLGQEKPKRRK
jgi:putative membrane protein